LTVSLPYLSNTSVTLLSHVQGVDLRLKVTADVCGKAQTGQDQAQEILVQLAAVVNLHGGMRIPSWNRSVAWGFQPPGELLPTSIQ